MALAHWSTFDGGNGFYYYIHIGHGFNTYYPWYEDRDVVVVGGGGTDHIFAGDGDDIVAGNAGGDILDGGAGDDSVSGQSGDDKIHTSQGYDTLNGGSDVDTLSLSSHTISGVGWTVNLGNEMAFQFQGNIFAGGQLNVATVLNFENVEGSRFDDDITADNSANFIIDSDRGWSHDNDRISALGGDDTIILQGGGQDTVYAGSGNDTIQLRGVSQDSSLYGGADTDVFEFENRDQLTGRIATIQDFNITQYDQIKMDDDLTFDENGGGELGVETFWITQSDQYATIHVDRTGDAQADYTIDVVMIAGGELLYEYDFIAA